MTTRHLVPCRCGKKIPVDIAQAGQMVDCPCGAKVEVPTLLKLTRLEPVPISGGQETAGNWGWWQRIAMVGALLVVAGSLMAVVVYARRPAPPWIPTPDEFRQDAEAANLARSVAIWLELQQGLDPNPWPEQAAHAKALAASNRWLLVAAAIAAIGLAVLASSLAVARRPDWFGQEPNPDQPARGKGGHGGRVLRCPDQ